MYQLIDTHTHLDEIENLPLALDKAKEVGVTAIIAVGSNYVSNLKTLKISEEYAGFVYPALGLHPWEIGNLNPSQIEANLRFIEARILEIVAIGEIGLDYDKRVIKIAPKELQKEIFHRLLTLAKLYQKPVIIHSRYAWQDAYELTTQVKIERAVFHWFTGFYSVLRDILQAGYFISATPAAEYHQEHRRAIKEAPLNRLILETDCPVIYGRETKYMSQPVDILRTLTAVATVKEIDEATLAKQTTQNAIDLFKLK